MTTATTEPWEQVDALDDGRGFVDRSSDRMLQVRGADARRWLGDLVTADVASLPSGSSTLITAHSKSLRKAAAGSPTPQGRPRNPPGACGSGFQSLAAIGP